MNLFKRFTALLLAVLLVTGLFPVHASADEQEPLTFETNYINPLYADIVTEEDIPPVVTQRVQTYETVKYATTVEEAGIVLREQMKARMEAPVVHIFANISATQEEFDALCKDLYEVAITHTQESNEGDYILWHLSGYEATGKLYAAEGGYNIDITYSMVYHSNAEQEAAVDAAVEELLAQLNLSGRSDYEKVKAVYDYICKNVRYDKTSSGTLKHTAYAALIKKTAVCQGYASLLYRLLLELGVDTRVIAGSTSGGDHGWNIVELDSLYYNADSTWDEGNTSYSWFLKSPANFPDHNRFAEYTTEAFTSAYPMASADYVPHTHNYSAAVTAPTCTEQGYTTYTCSCGDTYVGDYVDATGHSFGNWYQTKAPTEDEVGEERRDCENCDVYETQEVEKLQHTHNYTSAITAPTCTDQGYTTYTCACGDSYMGDYVDAAGHSFGSWYQTKAPTEDAFGEEQRDCEKCEHFETRKIEKLPLSEQYIQEQIDRGVNPVVVDQNIVLRNDFVVPENVFVRFNGCTIRVPEGTTLTVKGQLGHWFDAADLIVDEGASLVNQGYIGTSGILNIKGNFTGNPVHTAYRDTITIYGIPDSDIWMHHVLDKGDPKADHLDLYLDCLEKINSSNYAGYCLLLHGSLTLPEDLVIPENWYFILESNPFTMTIPQGVTVTNYGVFSCYADQTVQNNGTFENYGTLDIQGKWLGNQPVKEKMTQEELEADLAEADTDAYYLNAEVTLERDMTIDKWFGIQPGVKLVVPEGVKLTVAANVAVMIDGILDIQGDYELIPPENGHRSIGLYLENGKLSTINGVDAEDMSLNCKVKNNDQLTQALNMVNSTDYGWDFLYIYQNVAFGSDVTIPSNCLIQVTNGAAVTVGNDISITNNGRIEFWEGTSLNNNGKLENNGELVIFGGANLLNTGTVQNNNVIGIHGSVTNNGAVHCSTGATLVIEGTWEGNEPVYPHDHVYSETITEPTCTEKGYTTYTCSCGDSYVADYVDAAGHSFGNWYQTKAPTEAETGEERRDCANCDHFETREVEKLQHTHNYTSAITAPTCTEQGYTTYTCACGDSYVGDYVDASGHSFGSWYQTKAPTEDEVGEERRNCEKCDHYETRVVAKLEPSDPYSGTCGDNLTWTLDEEGTIIISGTGAMYDYNTSRAPWKESGITIRRIIIEEGVTRVGREAFIADYGTVWLTVIPSTLTSIGSQGLMCGSRCVVINSETIAQDATVYDAIGYLLFHSNTVLIKNGMSYGSYVKNGRSYSSNVEFQGEEYTMFSECSSHLYKQYDALGMDLLMCDNCSAVRDFSDVEFDASATDADHVTAKIYKSGNKVVLAFSGYGEISTSQSPWLEYCLLITHVEIDDQITSIPYRAFYYFLNLTNITIPANIASIGSLAFSDCTSLTDIVFQGNAPVIDDYAFRGVTATAYYPANNPTWTTDVMKDYGGSITWVPYGEVHEHTEVIDAAVEPTCTETGLTEGKHCSECSEILVAQEEIPALGHSFEEGKCIVCGEADPDYSTAVKIASGWSGDLTWVLTDDGVLTFSGTGAMKNYGYKSEMPWYKYIDQITSVVINEGVTRIGDYAFYGMTKLETIDIAYTVTYIGDFSFKGSTALDGVVLPPNLSNLGTSAFYGCTGLTSIEIPASLYTVKPYAFKNCSSLAEVTFHEGNLMKLSDGSFYGTALTEVEFPECLDIIDVYCFKNCFDLATITIPEGDLTQIREAVFYATAIPSITIPEGVTKVGPYAFKNCVNLKTVSLPTTLTSVGEASFYACTGLQGITIPDAVTSIGDYAFRKCAAMTEVNLGRDLTDIGLCAFYGSSGLTDLEIPDKVTTIQGYAFKGCTGLTDVTLGSSVETLGESAFHTCTALKTLELPASLKTIGDYCFSGSYNLWQLTFTGNAPSIGSGAFKSMAATAYYPANDSTWTSAVMQNYGGSITWKAAD